MLKPIVLVEALSNEEHSWPLDSERARPWLLSLYSSTSWWVVSDDPYPGEEPIEISFEIPLKVGTLPDYPSLYQSAKELLFWTRELRRMKTAWNFRTWAWDVFAFIAYLANNGIERFDQIESRAFEKALADWSKGTHGLFNARAKIEDCLSQYRTVDELPKKFTYARPGIGVCLARKVILRACGIPTGLPQTRQAFDAASQRLGLAVGNLPSRKRPERDFISKSVNMKRQSIWSFMFENRGLMQCSNFTFDPSAHRNSNGADPEDSPVPPPNLAFSLHAGAYALTSRENAQLKAQRQILIAESDTGPNARKRYTDRYRWTAEALKYCLATWIQTGLMTARRPKELWLMRRDCLRGSDRDGWYAKIYIVKNRKMWVWIPIPPSVKEAIEGLLALSPSEPESSPLFAVRCLATGRLRRLDCYADIQEFADEVKAVDYLAENDVPSRWAWTPKQLRRYTPHLFFWGYSGSIAVISHILHHFNVGQSSAYTRLDASARKAWKQVEEAFKRHIAKQAIDGTLGGHGGRGLIRDANRLKAAIRKQLDGMLIIDPDRLLQGMLEVFRRKLLVFIPKAWVICSCPETEGATRRAMCRKQPGNGSSKQIGPDFWRAGPTVCPGCIWAIENDVTRAFAAKDLEHIRFSCAGSRLQGTVLGDLQEGKLLAVLETVDA